MERGEKKTHLFRPRRLAQQAFSGRSARRSIGQSCPQAASSPSPACWAPCVCLLVRRPHLLSLSFLSRSSFLCGFLFSHVVLLLALSSCCFPASTHRAFPPPPIHTHTVTHRQTQMTDRGRGRMNSQRMHPLCRCFFSLLSLCRCRSRTVSFELSSSRSGDERRSHVSLARGRRVSRFP